jgi:hypothetical protein
VRALVAGHLSALLPLFSTMLSTCQACVAAQDSALFTHVVAGAAAAVAGTAAGREAGRCGRWGPPLGWPCSLGSWPLEQPSQGQQVSARSPNSGDVHIMCLPCCCCSPRCLMPWSPENIVAIRSCPCPAAGQRPTAAIQTAAPHSLPARVRRPGKLACTVTPRWAIWARPAAKWRSLRCEPLAQFILCGIQPWCTSLPASRV